MDRTEGATKGAPPLAARRDSGGFCPRKRGSDSIQRANSFPRRPLAGFLTLAVLAPPYPVAAWEPYRSNVVPAYRSQACRGLGDFVCSGVDRLTLIQHVTTHRLEAGGFGSAD